MLDITFINLWKYWFKPWSARDLEIISFSLYDTMRNGTRLVLFNIGIIIRW